jgi:hypothetical protein
MWLNALSTSALTASTDILIALLSAAFKALIPASKIIRSSVFVNFSRSNDNLSDPATSPLQMSESTSLEMPIDTASAFF